MNKLNTEVGHLQSSLEGSHRQLQILEAHAQKSIGGDVIGIEKALANGDSRLEYVPSDMKSFMKTVEYHDLCVVDLSPQMNWLSTNLSQIVGNLETAEAHAYAALNHTTTCHYIFKGVGQSVEMHKARLEARGEGTTYEANADTDQGQREGDQ